MPISVREIPEGESLRGFIDLQWRVNRDDPQWIPPLRMSVASALNRRKHPFHQHADVAYLVAERQGRIVGRVAAIVNHLHNQFHDERTGFFGLFECEDDAEAARALLDRAAEWLAGRGMERMRGPMNFSTNEEIASPGVLVDGFDTPPVFMMTHNPPYYPALLEGAGLEGTMDLHAFHMEAAPPPPRLVRGTELVLQRGNVVVRPLDMRHFKRDIDILKRIYNAAWSHNWGFVPMTDEEFDHLAKEFRPVVDPNLCLIAEVDGEPAGFSLALPDLNQAIRHLPSGRLLPFGIFKFLWHRRSIHRLRLVTLGIRPEFRHLGLGPAFYLRTWQTGMERGYTLAEASWVLDVNLDMIRPLERMGAQRYKTYRLYQREVAAGRD